VAGKTSSIRITFKGIDKLSPTLGKITKAFPKLTKNVERATTRFAIFQKRTEKLRKSMSRMGAKMRNVGRNMTLGLTAPIVLTGGAILKLAANFEDAMLDVQGKTAATAEQMAKLTGRAREMGKTTKFTATQAAEAMGFLGQAGFDVGQIMDSTQGTLDLAAATNMDLGRSADIASNILSGFALNTKEMGRVADVMVRGVNSANFNVEEMGESMKIVAPIAAAMGNSIEDTAAILGKMANAGLKGSQSGVALRKAFSSLLKPTKAAKEALIGLGINRKQIIDSEGRVKSLKNTLELLATKGAKATDLIKIFGERAGPKLLAAISLTGDSIEELKQKISGNTGLGGAAEIAALKMDSLSGDFLTFKSSMQELGLAISKSGIVDFARALLQKGTALVRWLSTINPAFLKWGTIILGVVATIGPLLLALGGFVSIWPFVVIGAKAIGAAILFMTGPIGLGVAALAGAAFLIINNWQKVKDFFAGIFTFIVDKVKKVFNFLTTGTVGKLLAFTPIGAALQLTKAATGFGQPVAAEKIASESVKSINQTNNATLGINVTASGGASAVATPGGDFDFLQLSNQGILTGGN